MKHILLLLLLLLSARAARLPAQTLERVTFANGGNANARLTFTLGEAVVYTPKASSGRTLSVGAQPGDDNAIVAAGEATRLQGISVFPNPTAALLYVECAETALPTLFARLFDASGRLVLTQNCADVRSTLDLEVLPTGTYTLSLEAGGKTAVFPIVKTDL